MASKMENTTLRFCSTCILLLICSLYFGTVNSIFQDDEDAPDCSRNSACKTVIEYGEIMYKSNLDICKCPGETSCPTANSVTRYIGMKTGEPCPLFTIYYCKSLFPEKLPICKEGDAAISFKGSKILPSRVKDVFCHCPKNGPLHLSSIQAQVFLRTEFYTCSMPVCNTTDVDHVCSQRIDSRTTKFLCRCPANHVCKTQRGFKSNSTQCQQASHSV